MGKKRKKKVAKKMFKSIMKLVGIGMASITGFLMLSIGVYAIFGGFKEKVVNLEGMNFEKPAYVLVGTEGSGNEVYDSSIKLIPTNEDATKLKVSLSSNDNSSVSYDVDENGNYVGKVGSKIRIKLNQLRSGASYYNKTDEFVLTAVQEEDLITAKTNVFIESKIQSINLYNNLLSENEIYPGTEFRVSINNFVNGQSSIFPSNSLNKPIGSVFYNTYGQNYFNKQVLYFSSNESIAQVDMLTGEVLVKDVGNFTIYAYIASTYENNSKIKSRESFNSDKEYFEELEKLTVAFNYNFISKSIEVSGITATNNSFDMFVNKNYKYAPSGQYEVTDSEVNFNLSILAPENSSYTSKELSYKLEDVEIYEGYKNDGKYYISANQKYVNNVLQSTYFDIEKHDNPLYFTVTPRYYTSQKDLYLIFRIAKTNANKLSIEDIVTDYDVTEDENGYYAYVKVYTRIVDTDRLTVKQSKILATYSLDDNLNDNINNLYALKFNKQYLNLSSFINEITPSDATYTDVRFFVKDKDNSVLSLVDDTNEVKIYEYEEDVNGIISKQQYIMATSQGTVQLYAVVYDKNRDGEYINELLGSQSQTFTMVISSEVNLLNFTLNDNEISDTTINKGQTATISFTVTNANGFKNAYDGFFEVILSNESIVSKSEKLPTEDNQNAEITLTGIEVGETTISLKYNGELIVLNNNGDTSFKLTVETNSVKNIKLKENSYLDENNTLTFEIAGDNQFNLIKNGEKILSNINNLILNYEIEGNNEAELLINTLNYDVEDDILEINSTNLLTNKQIVITPHKITNKENLTDNIAFYVYVVEKGVPVKSQTIYIKVKLPDNFVITANKNTNNSITFNSLEYEKVIGSDSFTMLDANNSDSYFSITGLSPTFFTIISENDLYDNVNSKFNEVTNSTKCKVVINSDFFGDNDLLDIRTFYFYVIPKYVVKSTSLDVVAGSEVTKSDLENSINLYARTYGEFGEGYKKNIKEDILINIQKTFNDITFDNNKYVVPANSLNDSTILLSVTINYMGSEFNGNVILNVSSGLSIENNKILNNNETCNLTDLFKVTGEVSSTITKVTLKDTTINKLKEYGITLSEYKTQLIIPQNLNVYSIDNLQASVTATINGEETTKETHDFNLNFKLTSLEINETNIINNTIYLSTSDLTKITENNYSELINEFVLSATESVQDEEIKNIKSSVTINVDTSNKEISFKLNKIEKRYDYVVVDNFIEYKSSDIDRVIARAYSVEDLVILSDELKDIISYSDILIISCDNTNCEIENNRNIIFKTAGSYKLTYEVLGRKIEISQSYVIKDIEISLENFNNIYSNLSYNIFTDNNLKAIKDNNLSCEVKIFTKNEDDSESLLTDGSITLQKQEDGNICLIVSDYTGSNKDIIIKAILNTANHTSVTITKSVTLKKLIVTTNFDDLYGDRQLLIKGIAYNLKKYFSIIDDNGDVTCYYNLEPIENYTTNSEGNLDLTISVKEDGTINKEIATIKFYVANYSLQSTSSNITDFYIGQTITRNDILNYIQIKDSSGNVINKYNEKITLTKNGSSWNQDILSSETIEIVVSFAGQALTLSITPQSITWSFESNFTVYPDTKISSYISAKVNGNNLTLVYEPVDSAVSGQVSVKNGTDYLIYNNNVKIATLNSESGEIVVENIEIATSLQFCIKAYVKNADSTQNECYKNITLNVISLSKNNGGDITVYIGENETNLVDANHCFNDGSILKNIDYIIDSIDLIDNNLQSIYSFNKNLLTNSYDILKNGETVASIICGKDGRNIIKCTSKLDACTIYVKGYLNISNSGGYSIESLGNNYISFGIQCIGIDVSLNTASKINIDNDSYYLLTYKDSGKDSGKASGYSIDALITSSLGETLYFSSFDFNTAFVGKVIENSGILTYDKKLYDVSNVSESGFTLPNTCIVSRSMIEGKYLFTTDKKLVDYVFITIKYTVSSFVGELKIALKPDLNVVCNNFVYKDSNFYIPLYAPSQYKVNSGDIFSFSNATFLSSDSISFAKENDKNNFDTILNDNVNNIVLSYSKVGEDFVITITSSSQISEPISYILRLICNSYEYYYNIKVSTINVEVKNKSDEINSSENPIEISSSSQMNLKDYIYVNNKKLNAENEMYSLISFTTVNNDFYSVDSDGNFTVKSNNSINGVINISFTLYGSSYTIYLIGNNLTITFDPISSISVGSNLYFAFEKTKNEDGEAITIKNSNINKFTTSDGSTNLKLKLTEYGTINNENLFHETSSGKENTKGYTLKYYYGGMLLIKLELLENNIYQLTTSNNIDETLTFIIIAQNSNSIVQSESVTVSNQTISVNYNEPVLYNGEQYQNVLSNEVFDLANLIGGVDKSKITYSLTETSATLNGSQLQITNINEDKYFKVAVYYNNIKNYINIKAIPSIKTSTTNTGFFVVKGEEINLYDYFKVYSFASFDVDNLPTYNLVSYGNTFVKIESETKITISGIELTFTPISQINSNYTVYVGESLNLLNIIKNNDSYLQLSNSNRNITFSETNNFVSDNGNFIADISKEYSVDIYIDGVSAGEITIHVKDLQIQVNYNDSILLTYASTNEVKRYEMLYSTQSKDIKDLISIKSNETNLNDALLNNLNFTVEIENCGTLLLKNFTTQTNGDGIKLYYSDSIIFEINKSNIICYNNLLSEVLINIGLSLQNNSVVQNTLNVRLMPIQLNINSEVNTSNAQFSLIYNVASAQTKCEKNNINVNDKIKFYVYNDTTSEYELLTDSFNQPKNVYNFANENATIFVLAKLGEEDNQITSNVITINYTYVDETLPTSTDTVIAVRGTDNTKITYTLRTQSGVLYYDIYNIDNEKLISVNSSNNYEDINSKIDFSIIIETINNGIVSTNEQSFNKTIQDLIINEDDRLIIENGIKVLQLYSGEKYEITNLLNSLSYNSDYENVILSGNFITAFAVDEITYGYFTVTNSEGTLTKKIYVKIYPVSLTANYNLDYTTNSVISDGDNKEAIKSGEKFHSIYIDELTQINLNDYININTEANIQNSLKYELALSIAEGKKVDNIISELGVLSVQEDCYIKINIFINDITLNALTLNLRIKKVSQNSTTYNFLNNSKIELSNIIDSELLTNVSLKLLNSQTSYISNYNLYVNETYANTIYLKYTSKYITNTITINIDRETKNINDYVKDNISYKQKYYTSEETNIGQITNVITNVISVKLNDEIYTDIVKDKNGDYIILNLLKVTSAGVVTFYDSETDSYIKENKLGVIYLQVEREETSIGKNYKVYENYRLNNYVISFNTETNTYSYSENGQEISNALKFSIVNSNCKIIDGTTIDNGKITANGITIDINSGAISGTKSDIELDMYIKAYVPSGNTHYGEIYYLFPIN